MRDKVKGLVAGLIIGTTLTGGAAFAASTTNISVVVDNLKFMVDGVQKKPETGNGFIYQGTTYVPLRFAAEATGKEVSWDGKNKTIWIGKKEGASVYLSSIEYARADGEATRTAFDKWNSGDDKNFDIAGTRFIHGLALYLSQYRSGEGTVDYNLNGKYKKLTGHLGIEDDYKNSTAVARVRVLGDGQELYVSPDLIGGNLPIEMNVDITGVLRLQIVFESDRKSDTGIIIGDPKLFQ